LEIPVGRRVVLLETVIGQESQRRACVASSEDDHIGRKQFFAAGAILGNTLCAVFEDYAGRLEFDDVASKPFGVT
jgi:hypothetical protein